MNDWLLAPAFFRGFFRDHLRGFEAGRSSARWPDGFTAIDLTLLLPAPDVLVSEEAAVPSPQTAARIPWLQRPEAHSDRAGDPRGHGPDVEHTEQLSPAPRTAIERPLMALLNTHASPARAGMPFLQRSAIDQPEDRTVAARDDQATRTATEETDAARAVETRTAGAASDECCEAETRERIHRLAARVFPLIRQRLRVEAERIGRF